MTPAPLVMVAGIGSEYRHDDAAGPLVAERAIRQAGCGRDIGPLAEPLDLLGVWDEADLVVIIDAVRSGSVPGTVQIVELSGEKHPLGDRGATTSTHGIGLAGALRLAHAVGHAPRRVVVVGIEGEDFSRGIGLSPRVDAALAHAVEHVVELISEVQLCA